MPASDRESVTLTIYLNDAEHEVPATVETVADLLRAVDLDPDGYRLYRDEDVETLGAEQRVRDEDDIHGLTPVVVSDGDGFVAVQRDVFDG